MARRISHSYRHRPCTLKASAIQPRRYIFTYVRCQPHCETAFGTGVRGRAGKQISTRNGLGIYFYQIAEGDTSGKRLTKTGFEYDSCRTQWLRMAQASIANQTSCVFAIFQIHFARVR